MLEHILPSGAIVVHENTDVLERVPGIPKTDDFNSTHTVITDRNLRIEDLEHILRNSDPRSISHIFPINCLTDMMEYLPTTFHKIKGKISPYMIPTSENPAPDMEKVRMRLKTRIQVASATMGPPIIDGQRDLGSIASKLNHINKIYLISRQYGLLGKRPYPILFGDITDPKNLDSALIDMKVTFVEFMEELSLGNRTYETTVLTEEDNRRPVTPRIMREKYPHVEYLKGILKSNLQGIVLYGSAAATDDPSKYSDLDNLVLVGDVRKALESLKCRRPFAHGGKVIECLGKEPPEGAKHIGMNVLPASKESFIKYLRSLHDAREYYNHSQILYGEIPMARISMDEVMESGISCAYSKFHSCMGNLKRAYLNPENLSARRGLYEFFAKTPRFFLQHTLNAMGKPPAYRSKEELNARLEEAGMGIPEFNPDTGHIRRTMMQTAINVLQLQREFSDFERKADFSFFTDGKYCKLWGEDVDNYTKVRFGNTYMRRRN
jgi:hypothetical protein